MNHFLTTQRIIGLTLGLALLSIFVLPPVFACKKHHDDATAGSAYMAISPAILATKIELGSTQTAMVNQYIVSQIAANGITSREFVGLTPAQQRRVMMPGRQAALSREERRVMQLKAASVPVSVQDAIVEESVVSADVIDKYGVALPSSLSVSMNAPSAVKLMLFGGKVAAIAPNGMVISVSTVDI